MPREAVKTGVVDAVVPLNKIAEAIVKFLGVDINGHEPILGNFY
jgi:chemotaxis response regulator CheB